MPLYGSDLARVRRLVSAGALLPSGYSATHAEMIADQASIAEGQLWVVDADETRGGRATGWVRTASGWTFDSYRDSIVSGVDGASGLAAPWWSRTRLNAGVTPALVFDAQDGLSSVQPASRFDPDDWLSGFKMMTEATGTHYAWTVGGVTTTRTLDAAHGGGEVPGVEVTRPASTDAGYATAEHTLALTPTVAVAGEVMIRVVVLMGDVDGQSANRFELRLLALGYDYDPGTDPIVVAADRVTARARVDAVARTIDLSGGSVEDPIPAQGGVAPGDVWTVRQGQVIDLTPGAAAGSGVCAVVMECVLTPAGNTAVYGTRDRFMLTLNHTVAQWERACWIGPVWVEVVEGGVPATPPPFDAVDFLANDYSGFQRPLWTGTRAAPTGVGLTLAKRLGAASAQTMVALGDGSREVRLDLSADGASVVLTDGTASTSITAPADWDETEQAPWVLTVDGATATAGYDGFTVGSITLTGGAWSEVTQAALGQRLDGSQLYPASIGRAVFTPSPYWQPVEPPLVVSIEDYAELVPIRGIQYASS